MQSAAASCEVPVIDIAPFFHGGSARDAIADAVGRACEDVGFLVVTGHGVPDLLLRDVVRITYEFFALPAEEKLRVSPTDPRVFRGYRPAATETISKSLGVDTPPDLCETFAINRFDDPNAIRRAGYGGGVPALDDLFAPNMWPIAPHNFRPIWEEYYRVMERVASGLMMILAAALDLPDDWFDDKIDNHISNMVANYYPPQAAPPKKGQLRRGAHTDYGSVTLLYKDSTAGGLEVQRPGNLWSPVPIVPGSLIVNLGDMMAKWTNNKWVSTMHRVVNPVVDEARDRQLSIAFFQQPNFDAEVSSIPTTGGDGPAVTSGEWVMDKLGRTL